MKKHEIVIGGHYAVKVAGKLTTVRVDKTEETPGRDRAGSTLYYVTNMTTGRKTTFRSAAKFRSAAALVKPMFPSKETVLVESDYQQAPELKTPPLCQSLDSFTADEEGNEVPDSGVTVGDWVKVRANQNEGPMQVVRLEDDLVVVTDHHLHVERKFHINHLEVVPSPNSEDGRTSEQVQEDERRVPFVDAPVVGQTSTSLKTTTEVVPTATVSSALSANIAKVAAADAATVARKHPLTDEQQQIVNTAPQVQVLVIEAGAGAGKTSTLVEVANALRGRGQYTAFNTSLVAESKTKFPSHCAANTIHSLGFRSEGFKYVHRMNSGRVRSSEIAAMLGITALTMPGADGLPKTLQPGFLAAQAQKAMQKFCQSADREVEMHHFSGVAGLTREGSEIVKATLIGKARRLWADASNPKGQLPFNKSAMHAAYVKVWQLNHPVISADYLLIDERQDLSPVMLDIAKQQVKHGLRLILVGDSAQAIYGFLGCVDAATAFPDAKRLLLSMSFRFGPVVAEVANAILKNLETPTPLVMRGFNKIPSRLDSLSNPSAVLCRTNAAAVQTMLDAIGNNKHPHLIGGGSDVLAFVKAAQELKGGRKTEHPELACFDSWSEVQAFAKTEEGEDLKLMVNLIDKFGADKIAGALKNMPDEKDADLVVSTAHKSKGREWDSVRLAGDFMPLSKMGDEELRLLYVAATRAKKILDVEGCPPFCDKEGIDLDEARRLSDNMPKSVTSIDSVVETPSGTYAQEHKTTAPEPKRSPMDNTWSKGKNGDWLVRGRPGQSGQVTVKRRNGSTSLTIIDKVIWQDLEVALYSVK